MSTETKYEIKELSGNLHKSSTKATDSHPDMFGSCRIDGKVYKMSGWKNESKAGRTYLSLKFQEEIKPSDTPDAPGESNEMPF
jgi:uncharacterized protein (DUF736 family)